MEHLSDNTRLVVEQETARFRDRLYAAAGFSAELGADTLATASKITSWTAGRLTRGVAESIAHLFGGLQKKPAPRSS
ncbi:MAG: hypothetical protein KC680_01670 [Candidatus Peregrinibacteria bacterium]|nr:hypothetical protein [Candidatus Peregrinibacteria bacterium]MCB9808148.1 hypothetical protein [Candidatus Peribacteria bacterium]